MIYTKEYLEQLRKLEEKNKQQQERNPGGYLSTRKEDGSPRESGAARMFERYGWF